MTGLDGNGQLETFTDTSGNGNHLACPAPLGSRPVVAPHAGYGNTPVVNFAGGVGTGQYASRATWTQGAQAQPTCIVFVGDCPANVGGSARIILDGGTNGFRQGLGRYNDSSGGWSSRALTQLPTDDGRDTPAMMWLIFDGVSSSIYIDDPATPLAAGDAGPQALNGLTMAAGWGSTVGNVCNVWATGVYKADDVGDFSESWRRAVGSYVYTKTSGAVGVAP